jgi:hypothetical protein
VKSPEERIQELARRSTIDAADAERLLHAVRPEPVRAGGLWNPFERWSAPKAALAGLLFALFIAGVGRFGVRTGGVMSVRQDFHPFPFTATLVDQVFAYPFAALVFWGAALVFARHARLIDILGVVGLARAPVAVGVALAAALSGHIDRGDTLKNPYLLASIAFVLIAAGFQIYLLVVGFRTATGLRGARLTIPFVGALIAAELLGQLLVTLVSLRH